MNGREGGVRSLHTRIDSKHELKLPGTCFARLWYQITKEPSDQNRLLPPHYHDRCARNSRRVPPEYVYIDYIAYNRL